MKILLETYKWTAIFFLTLSSVLLEGSVEEKKIEITPEMIRLNNIVIEKAAPREFLTQLHVLGKIVPNEERTLFVSPRFPGVVRQVNKKLGDFVVKGETLAVIESNETLQNYDVKSEMSGTVIKRNINVGMSLSGQETIFVVSDLSSVWADFQLYRRDFFKVKKGNPVEVKSMEGGDSQLATIFYLSPYANEGTQTTMARALLSNEKKQWTPGLFVTGEITAEKVEVPVAIREDALQMYENHTVVFKYLDGSFEMVPVEIGKRSGDWVEVVSGLNSGDQYASDNSYILKADFDKEHATHDE